MYVLTLVRMHICADYFILVGGFHPAHWQLEHTVRTQVMRQQLF